MLNNFPDLDISHEQWLILSSIFKTYIPDKTIRAFGSRVSRKAKPYSDLDLVIMGEDAISIHLLATLEHAFTESDLPFKVDVIDWATVSDDFRAIIEKKYCVLQ